MLSSILGGENERDVESSGVTGVEGSGQCGGSGLNVLLHTGVSLVGHHVLNFDFTIESVTLFGCCSDLKNWGVVLLKLEKRVCDLVECSYISLN